MPLPVHLHPEVEAKVTVNVARSPEQAERQAKGEDLTVREQTSMDDLGLEVGRRWRRPAPARASGASKRRNRAVANGQRLRRCAASQREAELADVPVCPARPQDASR